MWQATIGMASYCQKDKQVHDTFHLVLLDDSLSIEYVKSARYVQKILMSCDSHESGLGQMTLWPSPFEHQLSNMLGCFWRSCMQNELEHMKHNYNSGMCETYAVQLPMML